MYASWERIIRGKVDKHSSTDIYSSLNVVYKVRGILYSRISQDELSLAISRLYILCGSWKKGSLVHRTLSWAGSLFLATVSTEQKEWYVFFKDLPKLELQTLFANVRQGNLGTVV